MKNYSIKSLKYIASICLFCSYFFILFNSMHISVPLEYRMYYIEKKLIDWPGINGLDYSLNINLMFGLKYKDNLVKSREMGGIDWEMMEFGLRMIQKYI